MEVIVKEREIRRDRTVRYGERTRRVHLSRVHPDGKVDCICEQSAWFFAKGKAVGCRCRRRPSMSLSPKIAVSMCHNRGERGYHPGVIERIEGNRLARAWVREARAGDLDDVEL